MLLHLPLLCGFYASCKGSSACSVCLKISDLTSFSEIFIKTEVKVTGLKYNHSIFPEGTFERDLSNRPQILSGAGLLFTFTELKALILKTSVDMLIIHKFKTQFLNFFAKIQNYQKNS